jgi:amidophosphoribosyltransferase
MIGSGELGAEVLPIGEECGLVAIYSQSDTRVHDTLVAMQGLQHRGQAAAGVAVFDAATHPFVIKDNGLISEAIKPSSQDTLRYSSESPVCLGHVRYATSVSNNDDGFSLAQPYHDGDFALAHNGHVEYAADIARGFGVEVDPDASDSKLLLDIVASLRDRRGCDLVEALELAMQKVDGAASLVLGDSGRIIAARDLHGYRPLSIGRLANGGIIFASETVALDLAGASLIREVAAGEIVVYDGQELSSIMISGTPDEKLCLFEYIYFAHPNSFIRGINMYQFRQELGKQLGQNFPAAADIVVGVQKSGMPYAKGYSLQTGIPEVHALTKNEYSGRTFIDDIGTIREKVQRKHWPNRALMQGKDIVLLDDSIVRGNTTREIIRLCRAAGAQKIHVRIASPPYAWPCFYGMNTREIKNLIAANNTIEEIRREIDADSLEFLSLNNIEEALTSIEPENKNDTRAKLGRFCTSCMTGDYASPVPLRLVLK